MAVTAGRWSNTKRVVTELHALLRCVVCKKMLKDPLCLGRCEHYFCWSCADAYLGKACPLCGIPSHVKDVQPNRQLGAAASLCEQLMIFLGLNDKDGQKSETDPVGDKTSSNREADNSLIVEGKETKIASAEEKNNDSLASDIRPQVLPVRKRSGNLKLTETKLWKEKIEENENGDVCGRTEKKESEENELLTKDLSEAGQGSSSEKSGDCSGNKIEENSRVRPGKRTKVQRRSDGRMESGIQKGKKRSSLEEPIRKSRDAKADGATDSELMGDEGLQEDKAVEVRMKGRKRRKVLPAETRTAEDPGHIRQENSDCKSENNGGGGSIQDEADSAVEVKENCSSASRTRRRNVQMTSHPSSQINKSRRSNDTVLFQTPKAQNEFSLPDVNLQADNFSTSSSDHLLSSLFSTPESRSSRRTNFRGRKALGSPGIPQLQSNSLATPKSALVTPKTRSPATPKSSRGSAQKRNEKGETRLHVACIKGDLDAVRSLLEEGENPNVRDFANWTPLHEACNHGYVKIAELLLNYGAMINVPGGENATPLHDAVQNYRLECVRLLVSRGASKTLRDLHGKTPVDLALTSDMKKALNVPVTIVDSLVPTSQSVATASLTPSQSVTLLTTGLDATSKSSLMECAKKLNWKVRNDFSHEVTHLVTSTNKEGVCMRTIKYLQAILAGKWIVSFDWIRACNKTSSHVEEEPFEISGSTNSPKSFAPRKGRLCVAQQLPLLFNGCHLYFNGDFHHPSPSKDDLSKLVKLGSGVVLVREPKQETIDQSDFIVPYHADPLSSLANCGYFIVTDNSEFVMIGSRMCRVSSSWILSSIAQFCLVENNSSKS